jgi:hypothetical protein
VSNFDSFLDGLPGEVPEYLTEKWDLCSLLGTDPFQEYE